MPPPRIRQSLAEIQAASGESASQSADRMARLESSLNDLQLTVAMLKEDNALEVQQKERALADAASAHDDARKVTAQLQSVQKELDGER